DRLRDRDEGLAQLPCLAETRMLRHRRLQDRRGLRPTRPREDARQPEGQQEEDGDEEGLARAAEILVQGASAAESVHSSQMQCTTARSRCKSGAAESRRWIA